MPPIKIEHIISFSSEDPKFPADNLLVDGAYKKWKCKVPGEASESVIFQLEKASIISSIHIGNEFSAFIEVSAGRSGASANDFQSLLVGSSFMSPLESKQSSSGQRVRIFEQEALTKPACFEKWDRIKVTCMQPFNKSIQYGLSFITLHAPDEKKEEPAKKLGRFTLRDEEEDDAIPVGSLFAKRKEKLDTHLTGAAALRHAALPAASTSSSDLKETLTRRVKAITDNMKAGDTSPTATTVNKVRGTDNKNSPKQMAKTKHTTEISTKNEKPSPGRIHSPKEQTRKKHTIPEKHAKESEKNGHSDKPQKRPTNGKPSPQSKKLKRNPTVQRKPFSKLLDGVVFVLSGYQNPDRQIVRDKALEMGAKYKPDWCNGCTHLICAFPNTPKFQQVGGKGHIVSKQWIEDCNAERKRLPWRRYAVDRNDVGKDESEEEILEEVSNAAQNNDDDGYANNFVQSSSHGQADDSGSDTEDEIERVKLISMRDAEGKKKLDEQRASTSRDVEKSPSIDEYGGDTDVDSDTEKRPDTSDIPMPILPNIFEGKKFLIHKDIQPETKSELERYIIAFNGSLSTALSDKIDYLIAETGDGIKKLLKDHPSAVAVRPSWIWECNDVEKLLPSTQFEITDLTD